MKEISILIGAGFSVPDKYLTRLGINEKLRIIKESEIEIGSNGNAFFLNGQVINGPRYCFRSELAANNCKMAKLPYL
jgi:hypothetical protein